MAIFFIIVCIGGIFLLPYWIIPANPFPKTSGKWQVGTSDLIWNSSSHNGIIAKIWYPTNAKTGIQSHYIDNIGQTLAVMTAQLNPIYNLIFNKFYLGRILIPAFLNVTPPTQQDGFPVILFSPGDGIFIDAIDTNYLGKELLLINADRNKYKPKDKVAQVQYNISIDRDKKRIEKLSEKANLQKKIFDAKHFNFSDVSIIIHPAFAKAIGLVGKADGLDLLLQTSRITIDFFNKQP
jgi:hypothetical protein